MVKGIITFISEQNLANKITLLRIFALIPVIVLLSFPSPITCGIACFIFFIASMSDMLDGYIARKYQSITNFGKFLDPLADKLLICSVFIQLSYLGWIPAWVSIIIIVRELAVTGLRAVAADEGVVIAADKYGKYKTIFQALALGPLIYHYPLFGIDVNIAGNAILVIAVILTIYSGYNYFASFYGSWASSFNTDDNTK